MNELAGMFVKFGMTHVICTKGYIKNWEWNAWTGYLSPRQVSRKGHPYTEVGLEDYCQG